MKFAIRGTIKKVAVAGDGNVIDLGLAIQYAGETLADLGDLYGATVQLTIEELEVEPAKAPLDEDQIPLPLDTEDAPVDAEEPAPVDEETEPATSPS